jgi:cytochrome bd-type quinol oxidase subunit 2
VIPVFLVGVAVIADSKGAHGLAGNALLLALPFAAVGALVAFGDYLEVRGRAVSAARSLLSATIVVLLVLSCAIRSNSTHGVPALAVSTAVLVAVLYALKALLVAIPHARRLADFWPAKP